MITCKYIYRRDGDITLLQVDAITNTTNETLTERNFISDGIFGRAGSRLKEEISSDIRGNYIHEFGYV